MPSVGPELPPHLAAKRKREAENEEDTAAPILPAKSGSPHASDATSAEKRRRIVGPALPPAPLDQRPTEDPDDSAESDSDEDFGPALPGASDVTAEQTAQLDEEDEEDDDARNKAQTGRDEWMLNPALERNNTGAPDLASMKARKFNTGRNARGGTAGGGPAELSSIWTETPEQKRKRLANEVLGVSAETKGANGPRPEQLARKRAEEEKARKLREQETKRSKGSGKEHKEPRAKAGSKDNDEDDPSKRGFDWEKDMSFMPGGGSKKEVATKAGQGMSNRFASGSYL